MDGQPTPTDKLAPLCPSSERLFLAILQYARMWEHFGVTALRTASMTETTADMTTSNPVWPSQPCLSSAGATEPATVPLPKGTPACPSVASDATSVPRTDSLSLRPSERLQALRVIADEVRQCTQCAELASTRTQTVFGVGNPQARVCFFGEAPGADEDQQGEPFVGRAGQLLDRIIEACGMKRQDVYILNVLKCRPPGNRNPSRDESAACRHFFERQLTTIQPEYIVCLGAIAATTLLQSNLTIGQLRGSFHDWQGIKVLATYHPAYLLRNPPAKKDVWQDMKILLADMGLPIPEQKG
ncbi:MAG: uracil-DNA glycosylase [Planctomycetota bacterium]|nr:uracil-DNA glycosylase [Planctomycetota bacterium]MDA1177865.1 uracil-DNA glycosylase [Planctomycetota bacterium]